MTAEPHVPLTLRLARAGNALAHRLSGGRVGSLDPAAAAPRGKTLQVITAVHRRLYRWTGGIIGDNTDGLATLLLTTTGRKTGLERTVPLPYFPHPEGVAVVASFAGGPKNPAWYENLVAQPQVGVQIGRRRYRAVATPLTGDQRAMAWAWIVAAAPMYADYQKSTAREIPVVVLRER